MLSRAEDDPHNTDGGTVCQGQCLPVPTITLPDILTRDGRLVSLLKLAYEGAEYTIRDGVDLPRVQNVCGEAYAIVNHGKRRSVANVIATHSSHPTVEQFRGYPITTNIAQNTLGFQGLTKVKTGFWDSR